MIGKKLFGGSGLPTGPGLAPVCRSGVRGPPVRARVRGQEAGGAVFLLDRSPAGAPSKVTISCYLQSDDERTQPQKSHDPLGRVHA